MNTLTVVTGSLATLAYALGSLYLYRKVSLGTPLNSTQVAVIGMPAGILHAIYATQVLYSSHGIDLSFFPVLTFVALTLSVATTAACMRQRVHVLSLVVFPLACIALVANLVFSKGALHRTQMEPGLLFHVVTSVIAYTLLAFAACQALLLNFLDKRIRGHASITLLNVLPPLETVDKNLFLWLWSGLALLTIANLSGLIFLWDQLLAGMNRFHIVFSVVAWLIYVALMGGHYLFGWRGRLTTTLSTLAFTFLLFGYFGTKLYFEYGLSL